MSTAQHLAGPASATAVRFTDVLSAEVTKIRTLPAPWIAVVVAFAANTLLGALAATDTMRFAGPDGQISIGQFGTLLLSPAYAFIAVAVFAAGSEYRSGQLGVSLAAVPNRTRLSAAKLSATAMICVLAAVPVTGPGYLLQHYPDLVAGDLRAAQLLTGLGTVVGVYLLLSLIGYGLAVVVKSVVTPVAALFAIPILVSPMLQGALPDVVRLLPHEAALSILGNPTDPSSALDVGAASLTLSGWAAVFVLLSCWCLARRDSHGG
ncbi:MULTISPECIES: hypothetical protein [Actinoalloteichus]|uniref:ABC-2 family transporter protein n=1 Tax=Actinoalloteichus fjordicus TaxID=1612552 RepID=A0AAC9LBW0_9PSEU|nr:MULTISPECIES: hypothetical protein [Actinoalloteichus]APU15108.1 ABC-2 family transporter protein [Actinoalloteichus fjordicus]APU21176.1 ABC-2 family transporter protein [Actinoalloteichus sp. GBA129-24]